MLQIQNVTLIHRRDNRTLIEGLSFVLRPGDRIAVIGEEGNGKSTLLKWLYDPALTQPYIAATGERIVRDETLGYLPQELPPAQRAASVYEFFCAEEAFYAQTPRNLGRLASSLGLAADFFYREQQMGTLSGGEKIKAQLARLLMGNPTVLLLDEPSNDLDLNTLSWLETFLVGLKASVLFVSHDETLLERVATGVVHLEQLRHKARCRATVARVPYAVYAQQRAENMENERRLALNGRREEAARQEKLMRIRQKVERDQQTISRRDPHGGYLLKKENEGRYITGAALCARGPGTRTDAGGGGAYRICNGRTAHCRGKSGNRFPSGLPAGAGRPAAGAKHFAVFARRRKSMHYWAEWMWQNDAAARR